MWERGYAATSVRDLGEAMGLGAASLYNAFGDKRSLFIRCLHRYLEGGIRGRLLELEASLPPRDAIGAFFEEIATVSLEDRRGCLLVNTALEVAPHDAEIAAIVAERIAVLEGFLRRCVSARQRAGAIARRHPARDLARLLVTTAIGLRVLARARPEAALLRGAVRQALSLLDAHEATTIGRRGASRPATARQAGAG